MWLVGSKSVTVENEKVAQGCPAIIHRDSINPWSFDLSPFEFWGAVARTTTFERGFYLWWESVGLWFQLSRMFRQSGNELSLQRDPRRVFKDFRATEFTGKMGSGLASLYMNQLGYEFMAHTEDTVHLSKPNTCRDPKKKTPDWLYSMRDGTTAVLEAKGSLSNVWTSTSKGFRWQVRPFKGGARKLNGQRVDITRGISVGTELGSTRTVIRTIHTDQKSGTTHVPQVSAVASHHFGLIAQLMGMPTNELGRVPTHRLRHIPLQVVSANGRQYVYRSFRRPFRNELMYYLIEDAFDDIVGAPWPFFGMEINYAQWLFDAITRGEGIPPLNEPFPQVEVDKQVSKQLTPFADGSAVASVNKIVQGEFVRWSGEDFR